MKKTLLTNLFLLCVTVAVKAQNFPVLSWTKDEIEMTKYTRDTSASAVVLNEYGDAKIDLIGDDDIRLVYKYHVKIKILNENGFKYGTVEIPLYSSSSGESKEEISEITGTTIYKDNNGNIQTEKLDNEKVYTIKNYKTKTTIKFAMPALKAGCIIEYSYTTTSPFLEGFQSWLFQSDIPKVHSEYQAHIPGFWTYNISLKGVLKLTKNISDVERDCLSVREVKTNCSYLDLGMDNIPAFIKEDYMTTPKNFMSAVYFELSEFINPFSGAHTKLAKQWIDVDYELKRDGDFGGEIKRNDLLKDRIAPVIAGKIDELAKAKAVYAYLQKTMKWNELYSFTSRDGIRKALDKHTGDVGDINLALVSALNAAGINTEAVLLSTREHGIINKLYPVITEFDYVLAKANIGDKSYLLDATDPLLSFGMLPLRCLNDQGRVMNLTKPSYWIDITTPQKESSTYTFNLTLQQDGKLKGTFTNISKGYAAYQKRKAIKKSNSIDEYVEKLNEELPKIKIIKSTVENVDSLDLSVAETYEIEMDAYKNLNNNKFSFNPYLFGKINTNPFKLAERNYPVDWGIPSETRFILQMQLPDGFTIEDHPQTSSIGLPNDGGSFITNYDIGTNSFTFSNVISIKKTVYMPQEYPYLKELFNKIILLEKSEMVFKKKI